MARGDCLIIQVAVAMIILSTLAIALRFWSRSLAAQHRRFGADDWLALGAWVSPSPRYPPQNRGEGRKVEVAGRPDLTLNL